MRLEFATYAHMKKKHLFQKPGASRKRALARPKVKKTSNWAAKKQHADNLAVSSSSSSSHPTAFGYYNIRHPTASPCPCPMPMLSNAQQRAYAI